MTRIRLATGPVSWGVDFADAAGNPPWNQVLDEIASSELDALELGPIGYLPEEPDTLRQELRQRGLAAVGSFIFEDLHNRLRTPEILAQARRTCRAIAAAGGRFLVIIDRPGPERAATAGRSRSARRLESGEWEKLLRVIREIADVATAHDLVPVVHPHAGTYLEFEDEIDRLLTDCELGICLDTGHAAYAGIKPECALVAYGARITHLHLKDVDGVRLGRARTERLDFWKAIAAGVFCPLGTGIVDLGGVSAALRRIEYGGFATIEQDRVPGSGAPLEDLEKCLGALHAAGIGTKLARADQEPAI